MPLIRYFIWVGSLLLAALFIADWYWPSDVTPPPAKEQRAEAPSNSMVLRIQSARKLPEKIVFDTSIPTIEPSPAPGPIAPPAPPVLAEKEKEAAASPLDARAEMKSGPRAQAKRSVAASAASKRSSERPERERSERPERLARAHHNRIDRTVASRPVGSTWASAYPMAAQPMAPPMWSFRW